MNTPDEMHIRKCPICQKTDLESNEICECGYDSTQKFIPEETKIRNYILKFRIDKNWIEEVRAKQRIHEVQQAKKGKSYVGSPWGWKIKDTAELLGEAKSMISDDLKLAESLDSHPELTDCSNKSQARRRLKELEGFRIFERVFGKSLPSEDELHRFIEGNWQKIPFFENWELRESKLNTGGAGEIDLLAYDKQKNNWVVIEIKKDRSPDKTVGQTLRYMGWIRENLAQKEDEVNGLIISGYPPDKFIRYAILGAQNIDYRIYYVKNGKLGMVTGEEAYEWYIDPMGKIDRLLENR
jgi:hypothetical protein